MMNPQKRRFRLALPVFILIAALGFGAIVQWLWNAVLPAAANFNTITYWQAVGLFVLCKILFGGFKGPGGHPHRHKWQRFNGRFGRGGREEMRAWKSKWMKMTDEERIRFRQEMWNRRRKPPENW
ncbi:hypothetical protein [Dyadobacter fermentans]|uniref:Transmembrane protein n=1 Tax=Dyadobacter fermentans (strain ATCC 700827 / DSM 18053 / CIP 107007 / KCTC 52180 / NS114) TaxID=471854 RepID=C6W6U2_DYAFD|nr:hypothetical protein [Dyadobacter fermentans]ACT96153.1 conserved hypothetical protein [Dyadobacter fermentans DSM 18053]